MKEAFFDAIDKAVLGAVALLYAEYDEILIDKNEINGTEVPLHVYSAILERIKFNADLQGENSKPGAESQVMLDVQGKPKVFSVKILESGGLSLTTK